VVALNEIKTLKQCQMTVYCTKSNEASGSTLFLNNAETEVSRCTWPSASSVKFTTSQIIPKSKYITSASFFVFKLYIIPEIYFTVFLQLSMKSSRPQR